MEKEQAAHFWSKSSEAGHNEVIIGSSVGSHSYYSEQ